MSENCGAPIEKDGKIHRVFVYGTLKKNLPNHDWLTDNGKGMATFIGDAFTEELFPLVIASQYHIPCLLYTRNVGHHVKGEVYEVDDQMLLNLDKLEEHPHLYERIVAPIRLCVDNKNLPDKPEHWTYENTEAWIYFIRHMNANLLQEPYLSDYQNSNEDKKYIARYLRDPTKNHRYEIVAQ